MDTNPVLMNKLSMDSDIPLYSQLVSIIKRNISAGTLTPGALLPSEAELCRTFDVSRSTASRDAAPSWPSRRCAAARKTSTPSPAR